MYRTYSNYIIVSLSVTFLNKDLVRKLLKVNVKERLTVDEALRHPWVRGIAAASEHMEEVQSNIKKFNARRKMKVWLVIA